MKIVWVLVTLVALVGAASIPVAPVTEGKVRYDNYSVYKLLIKSKTQMSVIQLIQKWTDKFNIWKDYDEVSKEVHIMIKPEEVNNFKKLMTVFDFQTELMIENVQELIDEEKSTGLADAEGAFGWSRYYKLHEIEAWLDGILTEYSTVTEGFTIGQSYEGRNIRGIKISYKSGNPVIFIESNIHAREWITSATATWFINELLTSEKGEVRNLAENYDWYIIPVFNVDGFAYSHERDRMWRKTRQPIATSDCIGADANRNFDSHWMEAGGASANPCSEGFAGAAPFSEPETKALASYIARIKNKISIYISFHSYGQYLLSPYGHTTAEAPTNYDDLVNIGKSFADAIGELPYKTKYEYGSMALVLYVASGTSVDWVFNEQNVEIAYTIEYRDRARFGFILPPVQILPNCEELMAGMLALVDKSSELGYI